MSKWTCKRTCLIGKCAAWASGTQTAPAADPKIHSYSVTMRREVLKVTMPPPMAASRLQTAIRTDALGYQRAGHDPSAGLPAGNVIDHDVAARRPLLPGIHGYPPDLSLQRIVTPHTLRQSLINGNATRLNIKKARRINNLAALQSEWFQGR